MCRTEPGVHGVTGSATLLLLLSGATSHSSHTSTLGLKVWGVKGDALLALPLIA